MERYAYTQMCKHVILFANIQSGVVIEVDAGEKKKV